MKWRVCEGLARCRDWDCPHAKIHETWTGCTSGHCSGMDRVDPDASAPPCAEYDTETEALGAIFRARIEEGGGEDAISEQPAER